MGQLMFLRIQRHDFSVQESFETSREDAVRTFLSYDWMRELALQREVERRGGEVCTVGLELTDDSGHRLFLSPIDRETLCFNYVYQQRMAGFGAMDVEEERFVSNYPMSGAAALIGLHYNFDRTEILRITAGEGLPGPRGGDDRPLTLPGDESGSGRP
jgi:hypothetical protein